MSRKTKKGKSYALGILPNGQVVRVDTLLSWDGNRRAGARGYQPGQLVHPPVDTDRHTRAHREGTCGCFSEAGSPAMLGLCQGCGHKPHDGRFCPTEEERETK